MLFLSRIVLAVSAFICTACGEPENEEAAVDIAAELAAFEAQANAEARAACGVGEAAVAEEDPTSVGLECYFVLSVEIDPCERAALVAHPDEARALVACMRHENETLIACCTGGGPCTGDAASSCDEQLFADGDGGPCDEPQVEAAYSLLDAC
jgi:hypothetical protein